MFVRRDRTRSLISTLRWLPCFTNAGSIPAVSFRRSSPRLTRFESDVIITMGCGDECPVYLGKRYVDWDLDDPAGLAVAEVRPIIEEIDARVQRLLCELTKSWF